VVGNFASGDDVKGVGGGRRLPMTSIPLFRASAFVTLTIALLAVLGSRPVGASGRGLPTAPAPSYVPGEVIVGYSASGAAQALAARASRSGQVPDEQVVRLPAGTSVWSAIARLRHEPGVAFAAPDYVAHVAGLFIPNDRGRDGHRAGWEAVQWNFLASAGVNAPQAWSNLIADHRPGGRGVVVAILDTGVAYRNWNGFQRSPDFAGTRFVAPYDFIAHNRYPLDRNGHGTFIAGTVAEATNNRLGLTGLAYGAKIMPVRVLDQQGLGDAATIAKGIYYAVKHGAEVINLSLEFPPQYGASAIPGVIRAISFAHDHGVTVVAAAGNDGEMRVAYPARAPGVISVGASTADRCLAYYSDAGPGLDLVAPGGGEDALITGDPNCQPGRRLPDISQMTFYGPAHPERFFLPTGWFGTSMAAAHVAATAALVIASGVIGPQPTPDQVLARLEQTARPLGGPAPNGYYGYGLLDAGAATAVIPTSGG
jgi:serine protease